MILPTWTSCRTVTSARRLRAWIVALLLALICSFAANATLWWDGNASQNWGNPDNWSKDDDQDNPGSDNPTPQQFAANEDFVLNISGLANAPAIILNASRDAHSVKFRNGAGNVILNSDNGPGDYALTLHGSDIDFQGDPDGVLTGFYVEQGAGTATINARVRLAENQQWIANENLVINGNLELLNRGLTIRGGRDTAINGSILASSGSITKLGTHTLTPLANHKA